MNVEIESFKKQVSNKTLILEEIFMEDEHDVLISKNSELSMQARKEGNQLYHKKSHDSLVHELILKLYSESIAYAPNGSEELALGYGNRSAFLLHVKQYENCIKDIERALSMTSSKSLREKLLRRKDECFTVLKSFENLTIAHKDTANNDKENAKIYDLGISPEKNDVSHVSNVSEIFKSVDIKYTEKYGRHLIAKQNFDPGAIIFVEDFFASTLNPNDFYNHCSHCLSFCWSAIPCHKCNWAMFCNEQCRKEAIEKYHDLECPVITRLKRISEDHLQNYHISIRALIIGLKEAGDIKKLKEKVCLLDELKDVTWRGFKKEGKFIESGFDSLYSLTYSENKYKFLKNAFEILIIILIQFAKYTTIFGKQFKLKLDDLKKDPDVVFIGTLLFKISKIEMNNSHSYQYQLTKCVYNKSKEKCNADRCCVKGTCISPAASLMNHSCYQNVARCFTEDRKIIVYALLPIKKGDQIFDSYYGSFYSRPKDVRQDFIEFNYEFVCDCPACKYNWPPIMLLPKDVQNKYIPSSIESKIYMDCHPIIADLHSGAFKVDFDEAIQTLSDSILETCKNSRQPTLLICILLQTLESYFCNKYNFKNKELGQCFE